MSPTTTSSTTMTTTAGAGPRDRTSSWRNSRTSRRTSCGRRANRRLQSSRARDSRLGNDDSYRDSFRNPIWQSDEDDDDIDDFRGPSSGIHFKIFSEPLEMTRYFESQMENMLKGFVFGFNNEFFRDEAVEVSPFSTFEKDNLRDKMLKSYPDAPVADISPTQKVDTDLDGKITGKEFSTMWNKGNVEMEKAVVPRSFSTGRSVRKEIIRRSDGTIEQRQVIRDSEGNEETTISREIGDKKYVVSTKKDKNGIETKSEDLFNMDESELKDFTQKWKPSIKDNIDSRDTTLNHFPWEKFFGPKL